MQIYIDRGLNYDPPYVSNIISFEGVRSEQNGASCCYSYKSDFTNTANCEGNTLPQTGFVLGIRCPADQGSGTISSSSDPSVTSIGVDSETCYEGIRFNSECTEECCYDVCIEWSDCDPQECRTNIGWYLVQSGSYWAFGPVQVPSCICNTGMILYILYYI